VGEDVPTADDGGYPEAGILVADSGGITVADSTISGFRGNGILTERVASVTITGTQSIDNAGDGVQSWATGDAFTVRNSSLVRNEVGIQYDHSVGAATVTIDTVTASENRHHGVWVTDLRRASVTMVDASRNGGVGIWLSSGIHSETGTLVSFQATISGSTATGNGQDGIGLDGTGAWWLTKNIATGNAGEGFVAVGGRITSSGNASNKNSRSGYVWDIGTTGTSTSDTATANRVNGVRVNAGSGRALTLTDLRATNSGGYGLLVWSGTASVTRGSFDANTLDGIRVASGGTGYVSYATAAKNLGNGVAFGAGSGGYGYRLTASSNGQYGLCTSPAATYRNYPPHALLFNSLGGYGHACDWSFLP
jgi:hypothetical protein